MAQATSILLLNSVSCTELRPSEIECIVQFISPCFTKAGMKKPEAKELVRSQARLWKFIEEECSISQINYGITNAYTSHKRNPSIIPLTMSYIVEQIQTGLYAKYFQEKR